MAAKRIVIAGGSGFLGQILIRHLTAYDFVVLGRNKQQNTDRVRYVQWDGIHIGEWVEELEGCFAVINLTGRNVNCRYNERNRKEILESRLNATKVIGEAIQLLKEAPTVWINAGSATIYRNATDRPMDEDTGELGTGFSVEVCKDWEEAFFETTALHTRKVLLRIAMVLGNEGSVLTVMKRLVRSGLGGKQGRGDQYISWIHEADFARMIQYALESDDITGVYNCSAPEPVINSNFMKQMREVCHMPFGLSANKWMLEVGAALIGTETELILKSRRVVPSRILRSGFSFNYPDLQSALKELFTHE